MPVLIPGPTTRGAVRKYLWQNRSAEFKTGGTTHEMITSLTLSRGISCTANRLLRIIAYSSIVMLTSVRMRQSCTRLPSLKRPSTVFVLPISIARSIEHSIAQRKPSFLRSLPVPCSLPVPHEITVMDNLSAHVFLDARGHSVCDFL